MSETQNKATMLYQNIPIRNIVQFDEPILALRNAVKQKSIEKFVEVYADLTSTCNGYHQSAGVRFIVIQKPKSSPFSDQQFEFLHAEFARIENRIIRRP